MPHTRSSRAHRPLKRRVFPLAILTCVGALSLGTFAPGIAFAEPAPAEKETEGLDLTNLRLAESLDEKGKCLLRHDVYPEGGVGYEDPSLPYDDFDREVDKEFATYRAELLRYGSASLLEVYPSAENGKDLLDIIVLAKADSNVDDRTLQGLLKSSDALAKASQSLAERGVKVTVDSHAKANLDDVCALESQLMATTHDSRGAYLNLKFGIDTKLGSLRVDAAPAQTQEVINLLEKIKGGFDVQTAEDSFEPNGRMDSYGPTYGGSSWLADDFDRCSTGFRMNTSYMLTAAHCRAENGNNAYILGGNSYAHIGTYSSSLMSANVDVQVIHGGHYTNRVWLGVGTDVGYTTSSLAAYGTYPVQTLVSKKTETHTGSQLVFSGSRTGQSTAEVTQQQGEANWNGCANFNGDTVCSLMEVRLPMAFGKQGDSGGPYAVYDAYHSRLIPAGIHNGSTPTNYGGYHYSYITKITAIAYLYGGASFG